LHAISKAIMNNPSTPIITYQHWSADWKQRIQSAQIKAALQVNREALSLYWELGKDIVIRQETSSWGDGLIPRFAKDLKATFPHLTGFSPRNLFYMRKWYLFYQGQIVIVPQLVAQLQSEPTVNRSRGRVLHRSLVLSHSATRIYGGRTEGRRIQT